MKIRRFVGIIGCVVSVSCNGNIDNEKIKTMLVSDNIEEIIKASIYISDNNDTNMVYYMLKNGMDARISYDFRYYGSTVYQIKMNSMKKLTGIEPPNELNYKPDSVIFKFYFNLAQQKGWIKTKD